MFLECKLVRFQLLFVIISLTIAGEKICSHLAKFILLCRAALESTYLLTPDQPYSFDPETSSNSKKHRTKQAISVLVPHFQKERHKSWHKLTIFLKINTKKTTCTKNSSPSLVWAFVTSKSKSEFFPNFFCVMIHRLRSAKEIESPSNVIVSYSRALRNL